MEDQPTNQPPQLDPDTTALSLTERHLQEWVEQLDYLRDSHAPADQLIFCQREIERLQQAIIRHKQEPVPQPEDKS